MTTLATIALCAVTGAATLATAGVLLLLALTVGADAAAWLWQRRTTIAGTAAGVALSTYTGWLVLAGFGAI